MCMCGVIAFYLSVSLYCASVTCICVCRYVIMELIDTEKDYVRDLGLIVEVCNFHFRNRYLLLLALYLISVVSYFATVI